MTLVGPRPCGQTTLARNPVRNYFDLADRDERICVDAMNAALRLLRGLAILPMPDVFAKAKRSEVMSRIKGRGNKETELVLARLFRAEGITGWRRHAALVDRPDFTFRAIRVAILVDGCFWHGYPRHSKYSNDPSLCAMK